MKPIFILSFLLSITLAAQAQRGVWLELGENNQLAANAGIHALAKDAYGNIYAAGSFTDTSKKFYVAKWIGYRWERLGNSYFNFTINTLTTDKVGNLYAGGYFNNTTFGKSYVAKWDGNNWSELGSGANSLKANQQIRAITTDNKGNIYAAGSFTDSTSSFGTPVNGSHPYVAKWNGSKWTELRFNSNRLLANAPINALATDANGNVYATGFFTNASGKYYVAKWNGTNWSELGTGANALNANNIIFAMAKDTSGKILVAGNFVNATNKRYVAQWNGTSWSELGTGANALNANSEIDCIQVDAQNNVFVGGFFTNATAKKYVAKWNGINWSELGSGSNALKANDKISSIICLKNGNICASGEFIDSLVYHYVAQWNGTNWYQMGTNNSIPKPVDEITAMAIDSNSNIYAAATIDSNGYGNYSKIFKWDGVKWNLIPGTLRSQGYEYVRQIVVDNHSNIYVSGGLQNWNHTRSIVKKWVSGAWYEVAGLNDSLRSYNQIFSLSSDRYGNIYAGIDKSQYSSVYKWNGAHWSILSNNGDTLKTNSMILAIAIDSTEIYVGGRYTDTMRKNGVLGVYNCVAKFDGNHWSKIGTYGNNNMAYYQYGSASEQSISIHPISKEPYVIGYGFYDSFPSHVYNNPIAIKFDSINWLKVDSTQNKISWRKAYLRPNGPFYTSSCFNSFGDFVTGGTSMDSTTRKYTLNIWNGLSWRRLETVHIKLNASDIILKVMSDRYNNIYTAGRFKSQQNLAYVAKFAPNGILASVCPSSSITLGSQTITTPGVYYDTLINHNGGDSIVTFLVKSGSPSFKSIYQISCSSQPFVFNGDTLKTNGVYYDTLVNYHGCDSIVVVYYTYKNSSSSTLSKSTCQGTPYNFYGNNLTTAGTYTHHLTNYIGCDSLITLTLTVKPTSSTTQSQTICQGGFYYFFGSKLTAAGSYTHHLTNYLGCDSLVTLNLTVTPLNLSVTQNGDTLTAPVSSSYQWIDCDNNNTSIQGATAQKLLPNKTGNYAVVLTQSSCTDTSACFHFIATGIQTVSNTNRMRIQPNPCRSCELILNKFMDKKQLEIMDVLGRKIAAEFEPTTTGYLIHLSNDKSGIYFLRNISTGEVLKFVKE